MLKKIKQSLLRTAGTFILPFSIDNLCRSLKKEIVNKEVIARLENENRNYVFAFWHGTMLLPWYLQKKNNSAALISKSKDGDLLARVLRYWNYEVVRGSSSSGGDVALGILVDLARNKKIITITPDGPRGPAYKMKAGAVISSKKSGIPIVLAGVAYKKKKVLSNWDKFEVPLPFTRARIVLSNEIYVKSDLSYNETSELILKCEQELNELQRRAGEFNCSD